MTLFYRAVLRDGGERLGARLRRAFAEWAAIDDDGAPRAERSRGRSRATLADTAVCGSYRLDQPTGNGRLRTTATWANGRTPDRSWVEVTVEGELSESAAPVPAPAFVAAHLRTARATDGAVPLEPGPRVVDAEEVDRLTGWLTDPARRVPIVVLTVDRADPAVVTGHAAHLSEVLAGSALVVRLYDVRTQDLLNRRLGEPLTVFGGGLRTYLPGLDPPNETYPPRHPVRGGGALRDLGAAALDVVVAGVIEQSVRRPPPADVRHGAVRVDRILAGTADPGDLHAAPPTPAELAQHRRPDQVPERPEPTAPAPDIPEPRAPETEPVAAAPPESFGTGPPDDATSDRIADRVATHVADTLADGILDALVDMARGGDSETARTVRTMAAHLAALTRVVEGAAPGTGRALESLRKDYDQLEFDYELLADDERRARERVRWLEGRLAEHADPVYGLDAPAQTWEADTITAAVVRARETLPRLELPEALDADAARLDVTQPRRARRWGARTWDALHALDAYAAARAEGRFTGGFYDWCLRPLPGRPAIPANTVSMKESDSVAGRPKFRDARTFRVPETVDPAGRVFMPSHIKLQHVGNPAPRMHFLDDAGGATGRIWIGYLGDHLPNTRTN